MHRANTFYLDNVCFCSCSGVCYNHPHQVLHWVFILYITSFGWGDLKYVRKVDNCISQRTTNWDGYVAALIMGRYFKKINCKLLWNAAGMVSINDARPLNNICRAGIQNGSQEPGRPRAFLNGQFRLRKAKNCNKTNNFPLCCQLRLRTATEWVSCVLG